MADDTASAPVAFDPDQIAAMLQRLQLQPPTQAPVPTEGGPATHGVAGFLSDVGTALSGGSTGLLGLSPDEQSAAGRHALLRFGIDMLAASGKSYAPKDFGTVLAAGLGGAQQAQQESENRAYVGRGASQQLAQQAFQNRLSAIKEALPLLRMQQLAGLPNPLAGGKGSITAAADEFSPDKATALKQIAQRESQGDPTALNYVAREDPTAYERGATASGKYQIVNSTWSEGKQLAGVDAAQYPTARDAPEAVQDKVASALYDKYGTKPWQKGAKDWVKDEQGRYQLATVRPPAGSPGGAPATAPAASATPAGVQVGGDAPPPPGGSTAPYTGGGIGAALQPPKGAPVYTGGEPQPPAKGTPIPAGKLLTSDAVGAIQAGMEGARTGPRPPTALTAGPGAPTQTATATPNAPQAGWGSKIPSSYSDSPTVTVPAAGPATTTTTAPVAAKPPPPFPGYMSIEDWRTEHPSTIDPSLYKVPPPDTADAEREKRAASQALAVANASGGDSTKAIERYTAASQNLAKLQQDAAAKTLELRRQAQEAAENQNQQLYNAEMERRRNVAKDQAALAQTAAENEKNRQNQIDLKNIEAQNTRETNREAVVNAANQKGFDQAVADQHAARNVRAQVQGFRALSDAVEQPGWIQTTKFPGSEQTIAEKLQQAGLKLDDTSAVQMLRGGITNLTRTLREGLPMGALSDRDLSFIERMGPTEWMDKDTRTAAAAYIEQAFAAREKYSSIVQKEMARGKNYADAVDVADAQVKPFVPTVPDDLAQHWTDRSPEWTAAKQKWATENNVRPGSLYDFPDGRLVLARKPAAATAPPALIVPR